MRTRRLGASLALLSCLFSTTTPTLAAAAAVPAAVDIDSARFRAHLISKAVFADGRLWLLMESGHLETLSRTDHHKMDLDVAPVI